jgi:hypothetical protein
MWYGAYLVIASEVPSSSDAEIVVEEPVYVIEADNLAEAEVKANNLAARIAGTSISFLKHRASRNVSYGFRRIVEISNPDLGNESRPSDESEICYQILKFHSRQEFDKYRLNVGISAVFFDPTTDENYAP